MAIAGATTAMVSPPLVPIALLGSTAPDWLEWVLEAAGQKVKHRSVTHYVAGWGIGLAFFLGLYDFHHIGAAFFYGGLTHVLADSFTVSGVPFSPHSDRRFHLFGGRLRTGAAGEYMVAWSIVACCFLIKVAISPGMAGILFSMIGLGFMSVGLLMVRSGKQIGFGFSDFVFLGIISS